MPRDRDVRAFHDRASSYEGGWRGRMHHDIAIRTVDLALAAAVPRSVLDVGCDGRSQRRCGTWPRTSTAAWATAAGGTRWPHMAACATMGLVARLSDDDLCRFARDGYLVIPDVVPEPLLIAADTEIDRLVDRIAPNEGTGGPGPNLWFAPRAQLPRCDDVLRASPALAIAEELVAPHSLDHAFDHIQVATTVPPYLGVPGGPHIDGHGPGQDPPASFTMLAGVLLTDQRTTHAGNLWVWPGSHLKHQQLFHERGTRVLQQTGGHSTLVDPPAALSPAVEVTGGRGDLVLAHFLLGHNKGPSTAPHVRRTIYYRLAVSGHADRWESTFLDPWTEYAPVRVALTT